MSRSATQIDTRKLDSTFTPARVAQLKPAQQSKKQQNPKGLPSGLRSGLEAQSGFDLSGVQVHRNSPEPPKVNAVAFASGNQIHLGKGQEKHLPHEGWHVVQQMQGSGVE